MSDFQEKLWAASVRKYSDEALKKELTRINDKRLEHAAKKILEELERHILWLQTRGEPYLEGKVGEIQIYADDSDLCNSVSFRNATEVRFSVDETEKEIMEEAQKNMPKYLNEALYFKFDRGTLDRAFKENFKHRFIKGIAFSDHLKTFLTHLHRLALEDGIDLQMRFKKVVFGIELWEKKVPGADHWNVDYVFPLKWGGYERQNIEFLYKVHKGFGVSK